MLDPDQIFATIPPDIRCLYVAYSGGVDSHVLLHLLAKTALRSKIIAIYINHGLQDKADDWQQHCATVCAELGVIFNAISVTVSRNVGESLEEAARTARYDAFNNIVGANDLLLTGHHRDDQAETFLLQLFRGSGLAGLSGMPVLSPFASSSIFRPLLHFSRVEILHYADSNQLLWVNDPSNDSDEYDRNYLRNQIMPLLQQRWPSVAKTIARSADHCAQALFYVDNFSEAHLPKLLSADNALDCSLLTQYERAHQLVLIRAWLRLFMPRCPSQAITQAIVEQVVLARPDAKPLICVQDYEIHRFRNLLYCLDANKLQSACLSTFSWPHGYTTLCLDNGHYLVAECSDRGINATIWDDGDVVIKARQGGERLRLPRRRGSHDLKKLYQERAIPPWERDIRPLIYLDGKLIAVAGLWVDESVWAENMPCIQINWFVG